MYNPPAQCMLFRKGFAVPNEKEKDALTRRGFLGVSSGALVAAGILSAEKLAGQDPSAYKAKSDRSASDPGPTNPAVDAANPDSNNPVPTDAAQAPSRGWLVARSDPARACRFQDSGWSRHAAHRWRLP